MTKKIKLESETECDIQNVQIENCNITLTNIHKRIETIRKRLINLELQYKHLNDKDLCRIKRYKGKNKK